MIYYPTGNIKEFQAERARKRLEQLIENGKVFELTELRTPRNNQQNRYLHLVLALVAFELGERLEFIKQYYFKEHINSEIFIIEKEVPKIGKVRYLRSTADLDSKEMAISINRFRDWASQEHGIYIPSPDEYKYNDFIIWATMEYKNNWEKYV